MVVFYKDYFFILFRSKEDTSYVSDRILKDYQEKERISASTHIKQMIAMSFSYLYCSLCLR